MTTPIESKNRFASEIAISASSTNASKSSLNVSKDDSIARSCAFILICAVLYRSTMPSVCMPSIEHLLLALV